MSTSVIKPFGSITQKYMCKEYTGNKIPEIVPGTKINIMDDEKVIVSHNANATFVSATIQNNNTEEWKKQADQYATCTINYNVDGKTQTYVSNEMANLTVCTYNSTGGRSRSRRNRRYRRSRNKNFRNRRRTRNRRHYHNN